MSARLAYCSGRAHMCAQCVWRARMFHAYYVPDVYSSFVYKVKLNVLLWLFPLVHKLSYGIVSMYFAVLFSFLTIQRTFPKLSTPKSRRLHLYSFYSPRHCMSACTYAHTEHRRTVGGTVNQTEASAHAHAHWHNKKPRKVKRDSCSSW